ncbi:MAG: isoleucine--tRNA ligase [bacterium]
MRGNLPQREPKWLQECEKNKLYEEIQQRTAGRPRFILHDGPPYANGDIHIGHAVNKVLKDIIIRSKVLSGFQAPYIPGWDCHGLPIEVQVEKKVGKVGKKVDARTFRQKCRDYAERQINGQRESFKRLGVMGRWDKPYKTLNFEYEADMMRALAKIVENGHLHKGAKPVHWCFDCGSALAEAEIEYQDKVSPAIDVLYPARDAESLAALFGVTPQGRDVGVVIWTTTPWTLPASMAVSVNPELDYVLVDAGERGYLMMADALWQSCAARAEGEDWQVAGVARGTDLEGVLLEHPFYPSRDIPIILGDHVTTDAGTGCVHTAPGHGQEDFEACKNYDIEVINPVGSNGVFVEGTEIFEGQFVWKANAEILKLLEELGRLVHSEKLEHSYPHCWRHKSPTAFRATPQWFISMNQADLRKNAIAQIKQVKWVPEWGEQRIEKMIEGRPDWCISRQRTWGVPIALFIHKVSGDLHPDSVALMRKVADRVEKEGIDVWYDLDQVELLGKDAEDYEKVTDILDVWFDSGASHYCVMKHEGEELPVDLYLEGSDQHRGWFQSSLLTAVGMYGHAPYKQVLTHGFVVDQKGMKMSKSLGNVVPPKQVVNSLGADILRLWTASADYRQEMTISDEILKRVADAYRRIRNTARFLLGNLHGFNPEKDLLDAGDCLSLDQWAIAEASSLQSILEQCYDQYDFKTIFQKTLHFCSIEMGSFYLDIIKDRLYTTQADSRARRSAQTAMYHILEVLTRGLAPILPFTSQEIWNEMSGEREDQIMFSLPYKLPEIPKTHLPWDQLIELRDVVLKQLEELRKEGVIGSSLEAEIDLYLNERWENVAASLGDELRFYLLTSDVNVHKGSGGDSTEIEGVSLSATKSEHEKCVRCWHLREDVGKSQSHPNLCGRCIDNIEGDGEAREHV